MADRACQSTDAENSRALYKASKPGDDLSVSNLGSVQKLASTDRAGTGNKPGKSKAVTVPLPAGDL